MEETRLDIVNFIENNPLNNLSKNYQNKFLEKLKNIFVEDQDKLFISSFYCYLNYNQEKDYVIDLNNIWKWLGFARKDPCKVVLEKYFEKDKDYIIKTKKKAAPELDGAGGAGLNKEYILMNIKTFKKLCLKACTKKADDIHEYYIKLEEILHEIVNEESNELKMQLMINTKKLEDITYDRQNILLETYDNKNIVYIIHIKNNLYKYGMTTSIKKRLTAHKSVMGQNIKLIYCIESKDHVELEQNFKKYLKENDYNKNITFGDITYYEIFEIENIELIKSELIRFNDMIQDIRIQNIELKKKINDLESQLAEYVNENIKRIKQIEEICIENEKPIFLNETYIDFIKEKLTNNNGHRILLSSLIEQLNIYIKEKSIKKINCFNKRFKNDPYIHKISLNIDTAKCRAELIKCITDNYKNVILKEDGTRTYLVNLSLKDCLTFYSKKTYENFIDEHIDIKNFEKK